MQDLKNEAMGTYVLLGHVGMLHYVTFRCVKVYTRHTYTTILRLCDEIGERFSNCKLDNEIWIISEFMHLGCHFSVIWLTNVDVHRMLLAC